MCSSLTNVYITDIAAWCNIDFGNVLSNPLSGAERLYINGEPAEDIVIPNKITEIKKYTFYSCKSLKSITVPDGITGVGADTFAFCGNLKSVTIPKSLKEIEVGAFKECNLINTVYYEGNDSEWSDIYIGSNNGTLENAEVNYGYILPVTITYSSEGSVSLPSLQKSEKSSQAVLSSAVPQREGYEFLGWSPDRNAKTAQYRSGDVIAVGEDDITLYAVWKRIVKIDVKILNDIFMITPSNAPVGCDIIFVCLRDKVPVYIKSFEYEGSEVIPFAPVGAFDSVRVMLWDGVEKMTPLCGAKEVELSAPINLLSIE